MVDKFFTTNTYLVLDTLKSESNICRVISSTLVILLNITIEEVVNDRTMFTDNFLAIEQTARTKYQ